MNIGFKGLLYSYLSVTTNHKLYILFSHSTIMGIIEKISHNGENITVEKIDATELRGIAKKMSGSFNDDFGVYFVLTSEENNLPSEELISSQKYKEVYIGQGGVIRNTIKNNDGKLIFSGPELCDLLVAPLHQRKGYGTLITQLRLNWLKETGYSEAFFITQSKNPIPILALFEKLQKCDSLKLEKIYNCDSSLEKNVYRVNNF